MTYPIPDPDEPRRYQGRVSMPVKSRDLDLIELPLERRLSVICRRAANQYSGMGLSALPGLLLNVARELDSATLAAVDLLEATTEEDAE